MSNEQGTWIRWGVDTLVGVLVLILSGALVLVWGEVKTTQANVSALDKSAQASGVALVARTAEVAQGQAVITERLESLKRDTAELKQELKEMRAELAKRLDKQVSVGAGP